MVLPRDYPFLDVMGTMLVFFAWVIWIWLLITVSATSSAGTTPAVERRCCG